MKTTTTRMDDGRGEKSGGFGEWLRALKLAQWLSKPTGPNMKLNDGWSPQDVERSWREYGDGGDSWWAGAS